MKPGSLITLFAIILLFSVGKGSLFDAFQNVSREEYLEGYNLRKERVINFAAAAEGSTSGNLDFVPILFPFLNISFDPQFFIVDRLLSGLDSKEDPDFAITLLTRILFLTESGVEDQIIEEIQKVPLWINEGDDLRVFWTENHFIMFNSNRLLLSQFVGEDVFEPKEDEFVRERVIWFLRKVLEVGLYEYNSHYLRFTVAAVLNLFDFSNDQEIVDLSKQVLDHIFTFMIQCWNDQGICHPVTNRGLLHHYGRESSMFARFELLCAHLFYNTTLETPASLGFFYIGAAVHIITSNYDPFDLLPHHQANVSVSQNFGLSRKGSLRIRRNLTRLEDKILSSMTMNAYAHPDYIQESLGLVGDFDLWEHYLLAEYNIAESVPSILLPAAGSLIGTLGQSSIATGSVKFWKSDGAALSIRESHFPGSRGYEQIMWTATTGTLAATTFGGEVLQGDSIGSGTYSASQLPLIVQSENVALMIYNPSRDLDYFLAEEELAVNLLFNKRLYDEVIENGNWLLGAKDGAFVAIHRPCVDNENLVRDAEVFSCPGKRQVWAVVVGTESIHQSFENFAAVVEQSSLNVDEGAKCTRARFQADGQTLSTSLCRDFGNINRFLLVTLIVVVGLIAGCVVWRRNAKKRKRRKLAEKEGESLEDDEEGKIVSSFAGVNFKEENLEVEFDANSM